MYELKLNDGNIYKLFTDNEAIVIIDGVEHKLKTVIDVFIQQSLFVEHESTNKKKTDAIFSNDDILTQLHGSEMESDEDLIMSKDEFMRVIRETQ